MDFLIVGESIRSLCMYLDEDSVHQYYHRYLSRNWMIRETLEGGLIQKARSKSLVPDLGSLEFPLLYMTL
jgi:hypothetical protein